MNAPQLPLALRHPPDQRLATLVGEAGRHAGLLAAVAEGRSGEWLYLRGPAASGKTHALIGACIAADGSGRRAAYVALSAQGARGLAESASGSALVAIDGIEAIAGDPEIESALFALHNRLRADGASVLYAAREPPAQLPLQLPDLRSRLSQCTQLILRPPGECERRELLVARAAARGLALDEAVVEFLFRRVGRDLGTLTALLDRIDRASLAAQRRVTVPFVRGLLEVDR
ncbi:MAG TPA: DnaA regulatory inactivator Hda [Xanthomonadaceae bacterium]|nr:DnaA regulatory inactivator Hda [Xanthomonadaceae bacterium]